jgi:hypothetical protein
MLERRVPFSADAVLTRRLRLRNAARTSFGGLYREASLSALSYVRRLGSPGPLWFGINIALTIPPISGEHEAESHYRE